MRTIDELSIERKGEMLHFTLSETDSYKMVRIIMGTLLEIGTGAMPIETIDEIFESKVRQHAGETVPAQGLFWMKFIIAHKRIIFTRLLRIGEHPFSEVVFS